MHYDWQTADKRKVSKLRSPPDTAKTPKSQVFLLYKTPNVTQKNLYFTQFADEIHHLLPLPPPLHRRLRSRRGSV